LEALLARPEEVRAMGERGRVAVAAEFSIGRLANRLATATAGMPVPNLAASTAAR
jgi:hypothetical protein